MIRRIGTLLLVLMAVQLGAAANEMPDAAAFESGDFIWPRPKNATVLYRSGEAGGESQDCEAWMAEKREFVRKTRADPAAPAELTQLAALLDRMSCAAFRDVYLGGSVPGEIARYGGNLPIYVGHVGIVLKEGGRLFVVEAMMKKGVSKIAYEDWLAERPDHLVWHGRLKGKSAEDRAGIARAALEHLDAPYDFWNFDLSDKSAFYCSKLAWHATAKAIGVALDDNSNPKRYIWYSPKQMMGSPFIQMLHSPGTYGGN